MKNIASLHASLITLTAVLSFSTSALAQDDAPLLAAEEEAAVPAEEVEEAESNEQEEAASKEETANTQDALPSVPPGTGGLALFPVDTTNLSEGEGTALAMLLAAEVRSQTGKRTVGAKKTAPFIEVMGDPSRVSQELNVDRYVTVEAVKLKKNIIITVTLFELDGSIVFNAKMTARSIDDFEPVAERLVRALLEQKSPKETRTLTNITKRETKGHNRLFVEKVFGAKAAYTFPVASGIELSPMVSASFDGRLEGENYFIEFGAGILLPSNGDGFDDEDGVASYGGVRAEVGGSYYLSDAFVSPYVGGGVMPRILSSATANLAVFGQAGLMLFRQSSSRLYVDFRVAQNLTKMEVPDYSSTDADGYYDYDEKRILPTEFELSVGVGW